MPCRATLSASRSRSTNTACWSAVSPLTQSSRRARPAKIAVRRIGRHLAFFPGIVPGMADYDLAIIGGGLNGVSVARDAAGRGLRVIVIEQGDLGGGASGASGGLVHGDLMALERRAFRCTREALAERAIWMKIAPHLVQPARFVIPAHSDERPAWLLRLGLFAYDRLSASRSLPPSEVVDITHHRIGDAL